VAYTPAAAEEMPEAMDPPAAAAAVVVPQRCCGMALFSRWPEELAACQVNHGNALPAPVYLSEDAILHDPNDSKPLNPDIDRYFSGFDTTPHRGRVRWRGQHHLSAGIAVDTLVNVHKAAQLMREANDLLAGGPCVEIEIARADVFRAHAPGRL
jgi:hypothetical protein